MANKTRFEILTDSLPVFPKRGREVPYSVGESLSGVAQETCDKYHIDGGILEMAANIILAAGGKATDGVTMNHASVPVRQMMSEWQRGESGIHNAAMNYIAKGAGKEGGYTLENKDKQELLTNPDFLERAFWVMVVNHSLKEAGQVQINVRSIMPAQKTEKIPINQELPPPMPEMD